MVGLLLRWIVAVVALYLTAYLLRDHGLHVRGPGWAFVAVLILGMANALVKPLLFLLKLITLPLNLLTLGLWGFLLSLAMNIVIFYIIGTLGWGFRVDSIWAATLGALLMSVINAVLLALMPDRRRRRADQG